MKLSLIIITLLILFLGLTLTGFQSGKQYFTGNVKIIFENGTKPSQFWSIKQIDSLTAATNIRFARYQN